MANAKLARARLRAPRAAKASRRKSRTRGERFPPEIRAPLTREIERQLEQLVPKFDEKKVQEALDPLVTKYKWNDWQCLANVIRRIDREN